MQPPLRRSTRRSLGTPNAAQLRRWAIHTNYRAIVDTTAGGGYGTLYGPNVAPDGTVGTGEGKIAGTEHIAYAGLGNARENVTLMVQVPATFDPAKACIVTGTSSGSRGVYGAIGSSGEWGLKRGCAVAYADKGTGMGVHNLQDDTVNLIDGTRTTADLAGDASNFTAKLVAQQRQDFNANTPNRIAVKHAHSEQNPEKDWGRDTLRAVEFALYVLNEQYGETLPSGKKSQRDHAGQHDRDRVVGVQRRRSGTGRRRGRQVRPDRRRGRDRAEHPDQPADSARHQARQT